MAHIDTLKCFVSMNVHNREEAISWGVTCDDDFNCNILEALRAIALLELEVAGEDNCPLENPYLCEIDELVLSISNDNVFKCYVEEPCEREIQKTCSISVSDPQSTEDCPVLNVMIIA